MPEECRYCGATFEGTTYDDAEPDTTVSITVDGEPVTPDEPRGRRPRRSRR